MRTKDLVCSVEYSLKLRDLGVIAPTVFRWLNEYDTDPDLNYDFYQVSPLGVPAFTFVELWSLLPKSIMCRYTSRCAGQVTAHTSEFYLRADSELRPVYEFGEDLVFPEYDLIENPANACAKMLIHLIEKHGIEVPQL